MLYNMYFLFFCWNLLLRDIMGKTFIFHRSLHFSSLDAEKISIASIKLSITWLGRDKLRVRTLIAYALL